MIQFLALFIIILTIIHKNNQIIEGIEKTCSGNLSSELIDFNCAGKNIPEGIKRCYSQSTNNYDCDNEGDICNKEGECVPTLSGGYCRIDETHTKIFDGDTFKPIGSAKKGEEINNSIRAQRKYKNLYSQKCNPFATKIDEEDLEKDIDTDNEGDYDSHDEFKEIDNITEGGYSGNIIYYVFGSIVILTFLGLLIYYRTKVSIMYDTIRIKFKQFMIRFGK